MGYIETPKTPLIKRYKSGIVSTEHIVESNTPTEAKSPSFPKRTDIIAELVALGIENRKNAVYLMAGATGNHATINIVTKDMPTSFIAVAIYAHLSVTSCFMLMFARRIPMTNIESGVTIFPKKFKLFISFVTILYPVVPTVVNSISGFRKVKKSTTLMITERVTGFKITFLKEICDLSPVKI